jgi:phosphatidate cytidylyltransferase
MLKTRFTTVALLLPLLLWSIVSGPQWAFLFVVLTAMSLSVYEMMMMFQPRLDEMLRNYIRYEPEVAKNREVGGAKYVASYRISHYRVLAAFCVLVMACIFFGSVFSALPAGRGIIVLGLSAIMLAGVFATRGIEAEMARVLGFVLSLVYAGFPWIVVWDLYRDVPGGKQIILALTIVWLGDTGGYFGGRFLGKTKLAPQKSPKKTWEGAAAGLSASMLGAFVVSITYFKEIEGGIPTALLCGFFGGIAGQLGDLVESVFKRFTLVKDSGSLLPGHGGILDRIDALLFAAPVIWFILYLSHLA